MIRRWVLWALRQAIGAEDTTAGYRALRGADPLVAWLARKRLRRALREAAPLTNVADEVHHARLAYLTMARGGFDPEADNVASIALILASEPPLLAPRKGPWIIGSVILLALAVSAGSLAVWRLTRPFDPRQAGIGPILAETVPAFINEAQKGAAADGARLDKLAREASRAASAAALGAPVTTGLDGVFATARLLSTATEKEIESAEQRFVAASVAVDKALAEAHLPFFVDADTLGVKGGRRPLLLSYYVARERWLSVGPREERAVHLWRLDALGIDRGALGYTRPYSPAAIVLLDPVEEDLVCAFLPGLAPGEPVILVDEATASREEPWAVRLSVAAGELIRRYRVSALGGRYPELERIGKLLARRRALIRHWQANLRAQGAELRVPVRLVPERDYAAQLERRISRAELREWDALHGELLTPENLAAFEAIRDYFAADVERHEIQHRIDYQAGLIPVPEALARMLGVEDPLDVHPRSRAGVARGELSAELAALAQSQGSPLLSLVFLTRYATDRGGAGLPHTFAAWVALLGVARELGVDVDSLTARGLRREVAAELMVAIAKYPDPAIRRAAVRIFEVSFGRPLAQPKLLREKSNAAWRRGGL